MRTGYIKRNDEYLREPYREARIRTGVDVIPAPDISPVDSPQEHVAHASVDVINDNCVVCAADCDAIPGAIRACCE